MFGKKSKNAAGEAGAGKPKSPRDILIDKFEQLAPGQEIAFRLPEMYGPEIIVVAANKDFPGKGHRFAVLGATPVDGKPGPKRNTIWEVNKPKPIADWLTTRSCEQLV